jgi:hypothetical protein
LAASVFTQAHPYSLVLRALGAMRQQCQRTPQQHPGLLERRARVAPTRIMWQLQRIGGGRVCRCRVCCAALWAAAQTPAPQPKAGNA